MRKILSYLSMALAIVPFLYVIFYLIETVREYTEVLGKDLDGHAILTSMYITLGLGTLLYSIVVALNVYLNVAALKETNGRSCLLYHVLANICNILVICGIANIKATNYPIWMLYVVIANILIIITAGLYRNRLVPKEAIVLKNEEDS